MFVLQTITITFLINNKQTYEPCLLFIKNGLNLKYVDEEILLDLRNNTREDNRSKR